MPGTTLAESQILVLNKIKEFLGQNVVDRLNGHNQEVRENLIVPEGSPKPIVPSPKSSDSGLGTPDSGLTVKLEEPATTVLEEAISEPNRQEVGNSETVKSGKSADEEPTPKW